MTSDADYFLEVESHFAARRGTPFIFSAKDWALLKGWHEEGVPLPVVIEAIDRCFDKKAESGRKGTVSSLSYCRHAVKEIWAERKDLLVGADGMVPESNPGAELGRLAEALSQAAAGAEDEAVGERLRSAALEIAALPAGESVPKTENRLIEIETLLVEELLVILPPARIAALSSDVDRMLSGYEEMNPQTLARTRAANLRRLLRTALRIPRLSLFG